MTSSDTLPSKKKQKIVRLGPDQSERTNGGFTLNRVSTALRLHCRYFVPPLTGDRKGF
jgi:hypothetical protein